MIQLYEHHGTRVPVVQWRPPGFVLMCRAPEPQATRKLPQHRHASFKHTQHAHNTSKAITCVAGVSSEATMGWLSS
jgi:hypothetical protein